MWFVSMAGCDNKNSNPNYTCVRLAWIDSSWTSFKIHQFIGIDKMHHRFQIEMHRQNEMFET